MFTTRPEIIGTHGLVASTHWLSAQSAQAVLEEGGNAFDAVAAGAFVLQVVQPEQNGPGGELPIIGYDVKGSKNFVINGQGPAPSSLCSDTFTDLGLDLVPSDGLLPACVPGAFGALTLMLQEYGTLRLRDVLKYALDYAENGFPVTALTSLVIGDAAERFKNEWISNGNIYLKQGNAPAPNEKLTNPALAKTYRRLLAEIESRGLDRSTEYEAARDVWYRGFVAEEIDAFYRQPVKDCTGTAHAGLLRYEDLAKWQPRIEEPLQYDYAGLTICKPQTWSQGGVLLQQLALLSGFDFKDTKPASEEFIHTIVESAKLAFADREAYYGDPDFIQVPMDILLSKQYNDERRKQIHHHASDLLKPGEIAGFSSRLPGFATSEIPLSGEHLPIPFIIPGSGRTDGDTVHLDVADKFGNMVSATPSGGFLWGAPVIPELGFAISTRAQIFSVEPGLPNSVAGGKRPRTTLSPSLAMRDGKPYMVFGTPGGDMQDQWPLIFLLNHLHFGMNLQQAIDSPTWHSTHFPSSFMNRKRSPRTVHIENRIRTDVQKGLQQRGHILKVEEAFSLGMTSAVAVDHQGMFRAGVSPRGLLGYVSGR